MSFSLYARNPVLPWLLLVPILLTSQIVTGRIPLADFTTFLVVLLASTQAVKGRKPLHQILITLFGLLFLTGVATLIIDQPPLSGGLRRIAHLFLFLSLAGFIASGRIRSTNIVRAIFVGLFIGVMTGMAVFSLGVSNYEGRLTGTFGDPNVASMIAAGLGMIGYAIVKSPSRKRLILIMLVTIVIFSLSRTGALALGMGLIWIFGAHKLPRVVMISALIATVYVAISLPPSIQNVGIYSIHNSADSLRSLIDQASAQAFWQNWLSGSGPGTAFIYISNGERFYFHNSYLAMATEFGIIFAIAFISLALLTVYQLIRTYPRSPGIEAGIIAFLIMGLTLGEVFLSLSFALALGVAWNYILSNQKVGPSASRRSMVSPLGDNTLEAAAKRRLHLPRPGISGFSSDAQNS